MTTVGSVYVHAPFCARRCPYCDFAVQVRRSGGSDEWLAALGGELAAWRRTGRGELAERLETLYVGGGTPSLLGPDAMAGLGELLGRARLGGPALEWTGEANPESFTPEVARGWRGAGVNRVSLGVQSFDEETLRWMGRLHGPEGARRAVRTAREGGFDNVGIDLIFALPPSLPRSWSRDLEIAIELDVDHVSLYGLTVEPGTPLHRAVEEGRIGVAEEESYREQFLEAGERLGAAGFVHYEVSNFARPGRESAHNRAYWNGRPYLGLGNGAHSFLPPVRSWNLRDWDDYQNVAGAGELPLAGSEVLEDGDRHLERLWLGLRTAEGVELNPVIAESYDLLLEWQDSGWATLAQGRVRLTEEGWLLLDRLAVELDVEGSRSARKMSGPANPAALDDASSGF